MDLNEFWTLIDAARAEARPLNGDTMAAALEHRLVALTPAEVVQFGVHFEHLHAEAYRWDLWAAAYLILGGCSDDSFDYFRSGLISLGRATYEAALANPDSLAAHPMVQAIAADPDLEDDLCMEEVDYAPGAAYEELVGIVDGDGEAFYQAVEAVQGKPEDDGDGDPAGEGWDFDDDAEMARRLPRLAALFPAEGDDSADDLSGS